MSILTLRFINALLFNGLKLPFKDTNAANVTHHRPAIW